MKKLSILWIIEISVIALIPALSISYDFIENSEFYDALYDFKTIEDVILYRFGGDYATLIQDDSVDSLKPIHIVSDSEKFTPVWNIIKKYSSVELSDEIPTLITRLAVDNAPSVHLFNEEYLLVPESVPIVVVYCTMPTDVDSGACKNGKAVGTLSDFKNWIEHEKQEKRNFANLLIGIIAIILAILLWFEERKKNYLLLN